MSTLNELCSPTVHYVILWTTNWKKEKPKDDWEIYWRPAEYERKTDIANGDSEFDDDLQEVEAAKAELEKVFPFKQFKIVKATETWEPIKSE